MKKTFVIAGAALLAFGAYMLFGRKAVAGTATPGQSSGQGGAGDVSSTQTGGSSTGGLLPLTTTQTGASISGIVSAGLGVLGNLLGSNTNTPAGTSPADTVSSFDPYANIPGDTQDLSTSYDYTQSNPVSADTGNLAADFSANDSTSGLNLATVDTTGA